MNPYYGSCIVHTACEGEIPYRAKGCGGEG